MTEKDTYSEKSALSLSELENFYNKVIRPKSNITFSFSYLKDYISKDNNNNTIIFIHTGPDKNEFNNGYTNHWLVLDANTLFDSYGFYRHYNLGNLNFNTVKTIPERLQAFDATVCGEYCLHFINFIYSNSIEDEEEIGKKYSQWSGFSENRNKNDEKILQWYEQNK
jgi:hypothetical protein